MKILLMSSYYPPQTVGGAEISTHILARGLVENGNQVRVLTVGESEEEVSADGVDVTRINIPLRGKPLFERWHSRKCARTMDRLGKYIEEADIIHTNDFRSTLAVIEWRKRRGSEIPVVATIRDYAQISGSTNFVDAKGKFPANSVMDARQSHRIREAGGLRKVFRWWQYRYNINYRKKTFRKLDGQVFISRAQMELTTKHQDIEGLQRAVIYNPVDDSYIRERLLRGHDGAVLYVGRVEWYKGVGLLLEAWKEVIKDIPGAHLKIVGDGVDREKYERYVENNGMGYRVTIQRGVRWDRLKRIYDEAQVVVAPHIWEEPFGRTVVEAMARGKIVVAANAGGPGEIIEDKKTGVLFKKQSKKDLVRALKEALTKDELARQEVGRRASRWVEQSLSKKNIATKYEQFYKEVIQQKK
jgi:glycosyltransferase involved in cell wall biosynthesis